ncbi:SAM-dependent methyltransferase [Streptomyces sp. NBC_00838]|uniref:SAM-dependent methyltransferase n=1 Tax=Streptomyces sp. NBC_00838 TaxID=2903680 RepID=UPI003866B059|nr:SAM-dependent methyltransferase [Streptomyces sp. NBC_00838]
MSARQSQAQVDTSKPQPARVYDWLLGGSDNYPVDQAVGKQLPDLGKRSARQNRAFMRRASAWVAGQGVDQFLDIGVGFPTAPNLHQVVQEINPRARIVYVDNDPIVLRHAEALLYSTAEGAMDYVAADVREPRAILDGARACLDFRRPVALSLIALMHYIPDDDGPYDIVRTLLDALVPGSYLMLSHGTFDFHKELEAEITGTYTKGEIALRFRTREEVARFFDGLDLVEPGLVIAPEWYKDTTAPEPEDNAVYAGVARTL